MNDKVTPLTGDKPNIATRIKNLLTRKEFLGGLATALVAPLAVEGIKKLMQDRDIQIAESYIDGICSKDDLAQLGYNANKQNMAFETIYDDSIWEIGENRLLSFTKPVNRFTNSLKIKHKDKSIHEYWYNFNTVGKLLNISSSTHHVEVYSIKSKENSKQSLAKELYRYWIKVDVKDKDGINDEFDINLHFLYIGGFDTKNGNYVKTWIDEQSTEATRLSISLRLPMNRPILVAATKFIVDTPDVKREELVDNRKFVLYNESKQTNSIYWKIAPSKEDVGKECIYTIVWNELV